MKVCKNYTWKSICWMVAIFLTGGALYIVRVIYRGALFLYVRPIVDTNKTLGEPLTLREEIDRAIESRDLDILNLKKEERDEIEQSVVQSMQKRHEDVTELERQQNLIKDGRLQAKYILGFTKRDDPFTRVVDEYRKYRSYKARDGSYCRYAGQSERYDPQRAAPDKAHKADD